MGPHEKRQLSNKKIIKISSSRKYGNYNFCFVFLSVELELHSEGFKEILENYHHFNYAKNILYKNFQSSFFNFSFNNWRK